MNNIDFKKIILPVIVGLIVIVVLASLIISQFFTKKSTSPAVVPISTPTISLTPTITSTQFKIESVIPTEDTSVNHFPNQQIGFTFNSSMNISTVLYSIIPNVPVNVTLATDSNKMVIFTPKTTWQKGITTITILPQTKSLDGHILNQPFIYRFNSDLPANPPADWKGY